MKKLGLVFLFLISFAISNAQEFDQAFEYFKAEKYELAAQEFEKALIQTQNKNGKENKTYAQLGFFAALSNNRANNIEKAISYYVLYIEACHSFQDGLNDKYYGFGLGNLASLYKATGQYEKALPLAIEVLPLTEKSKGKTHPDYGMYLNNLAALYEDMGEYEKALTLYLEAISNVEKNLGKEHSEYDKYLFNLAGLYQRMGQYGKALPLYLETLNNTEKDHPSYCIRLSNLAMLYNTMGEYEKALPLFLEALEVTERIHGKGYYAYGVYLNNLAMLYNSMGEYEKALLLYLEAIEIIEKSKGKDHPDYGTGLNNLAFTYQRIGQYEKAQALFLEAIINTEKSLGKEHSEYGSRLNNLAKLYEIMGQYEKAFPLCLEALNNIEKSLGKDHSDYGVLLNSLANLYRLLGQNEKALSLYLEALEIVEKSLGRDHAYYGGGLNNLALVYMNLKQYEEALPLALEALTNGEKSLGKEHPEYSTRLGTLATLYENMGQYEKALPLYLEALDIVENTLGKDHVTYAIYLSSLADLYQTQEQYGKALPLYFEARAIIEKKLGKYHSYYGRILYLMAGLYQEMGQFENALPVYIEGIEVINKNINQNFSFLSENEKEAYLKTVSQMFENFNSFALKHKSNYQNVTTYVFNNTLTNKGILLKSSKAMRIAVLNSGDTVLINKFDEWTRLNRQIARLYSTEKTKRFQDPEELEDKATEIERQLVLGSQEFGDFKNLQSNTWKDVQKGLMSGEAAIEFLKFSYRNKERTDTTMYCALILKPESHQPEMIALFHEAELENYFINSTQSTANLAIRLYGKKRGANVQTSGSTYTNYADSLYLLIWSRIEPYLEGVKTVYYSPSGLLHNISFAAIPYNDSQLLSEKYELVYVASTGNIVNKKQNRDINKFDIAIYGGLNYDTDANAMLANVNKYNDNYGNLLAQRSIAANESTRGGSWNYLKGTLDEAESIKAMFEKNSINTSLFTASDGIEESFKSLSGKNAPEIIHLATHGFFFPDPEKEEYDDGALMLEDKMVFQGSDNPLIRSGLIMSGANLAWKGETIPEGIDDGILTAYEVSGLDLYNTELVVLSACETGLGDIKGSEGVYGLQRSFKMAGVNYLVMSLWQVPDKETSEFMQLFYTNLLAKQSVGVAFRAAQKLMKEKYDPYYWAAFVLIE